MMGFGRITPDDEDFENFDFSAVPGAPCNVQNSRASTMSSKSTTRMRSHDIPDKVTVFCDDHTHTFKHKCWTVKTNDGDHIIYVHAEEAGKKASWLQEDDHVLASNVDDDGNRKYVADFDITTIEKRNQDGVEMLALKE